jgi:hypothetical protein
MALTLSGHSDLLDCEHPCRRHLKQQQKINDVWYRQQQDNSGKQKMKSPSKTPRTSTMSNGTLDASSSSSVNTSCSGLEEMKFTLRFSCRLKESPLYMAGLMVCILITLLCLGRWWIKYRNHKKKSNRRYLEMSEYAALATEYDELLEGVFESDEFTQYLEEDDEDANSIASILTEWSGDHAAELLRDGTTSTEIPTTFDIDLNGEFATRTEKKSDRFKIV